MEKVKGEDISAFSRWVRSSVSVMKDANLPLPFPCQTDFSIALGVQGN